MARHLDDWIDSFLEYTENEEPPTIFKKWAALSCIAAVLQRKCWVSYGKLRFFPNMYIILVGPSGCRKGTAIEPVRKLLNMPSLGLSLASNRLTSASLIDELAESTANIDPGPGLFNLRQHNSMTILSGEFTVLFNYDANQMVEILTDWYDCHDKWNNKTRIGGAQYINNVWVNILGATTPQKFASLPKTSIEGGLLGRLNVVYADRKSKVVPFPEETKEMKELWDMIEDDLIEISLLQGQFKISPNFIRTYTDWYIQQDKHPPFKDDLFAGYNDRRAAHVWKLCMLMSASRSDDMIIDITDLENAIYTLDELELNMLRAFGGIAENRIAGVQNAIISLFKDGQVMMLSEIARSLERIASYRDITEAINNLRRYGVVSWDSKLNNGMTDLEVRLDRSKLK